MMRSVDVLVVVDHEVEADTTLHALKRAAPDASVLRLESGNRALQYLFAVGEFAHCARTMPRLVLLDVEMPVVSGLCVLDMIRAHPLTDVVPVVMLGSSHSRISRRPGKFDADAYVVRPGDHERYYALIEKVVSRWLPSTSRGASVSE